MTSDHGLNNTVPRADADAGVIGRDFSAVSPCAKQTATGDLNYKAQ